MAKPGKSNRQRKVGADGADVLGQARDPRSLALVQLVGGYVPDYSDTPAVNDMVQAAVRTVTANMDNPNTSAPTAAVTVPLTQYGVVAFHVAFPATGAGDLELWADGGKDAAGNEIGWLLLETIAGIVDRKEYVRATGQRLLYFRLANLANVNGGAPAKVRAAGVA